MNNKTLANVVKEVRKRINISQRELSRITGIDNNTIAKIEKGKRKLIYCLKKVKFRIKSFFRDANVVM